MLTFRNLSPIVFALVISAAGSAQEFRATLSGTIKDPSGASVLATVTVRNTETNLENVVSSNASGEFTVPLLRPGQYSITVVAPGFKKYVESGIILEIAQKADFDIKLEVGSQAQSIEVTARSEILDSETASRSTDLDTEKLAELPNNYRNPYNFITNLPGVQFRGNLSWIRPFDGSTNTNWSMNGGQIGYNEILIDGASNTTVGGNGNGVGYVPTVDSVGEIKVQTSTYDAQYGRTSGGVSNVGIKSGTNALHGTLYEFYRRSWLDANTFQLNAARRPKVDHYLDQYGGEVDGPVIIPKIYNGRNRTFFTVSLEGYREGTPALAINSVPAPEFLKGDFSKLVNANGQPVGIYDPLTGKDDPTSSNGFSRQLFPGNIIPQNRLNATALKILSYAPQPNCTTPGVAYSQQNSCLSLVDADSYHNQLYKIDHNINRSNHIFFRYGGYNRSEARPVNGLTTAGADGQLPFFRITNSAVVDWVGTLSPTLIANVRASYTRFIEWSYGAVNRDFDIAGQFGLPSSLLNTLPSARDFGVYNFTNYINLGRGQTLNLDNDYALNGAVTKIWNNHNIHIGTDVRQQNYEVQNTGSIFNLTGTPDYTQKLYNQSDSTSGNSIASFLLGIPGNGASNSGGINIPVYPWYKQMYGAVYIQDDWKVTSKLTLNLGFRWDANLPATEKHNRLDNLFDTTSASPLASLVNPALLPYTSGALKGGLLFAGTNGASAGASAADFKTFQPRVGAAYKLNEHLVIRGGYGIYHFNLGTGYQQRPGFAASTPLVTSLDGGKTPLSTAAGGFLSNPFPASAASPLGYNVPLGAAGGLDTFVGQSFTAYNPNARIPRQEQYSLGVQLTVTKESVLELTYGGSRGSNYEMGGIPYNLPSLAFRKQCNVLEGGSPVFCNQQITNPFKGLQPFVGTSFYTANTLSRYQLARPFPQFNGDVGKNGDNSGSTNYNSFLANYKIRMRGGLNVITNYTFSKWTQTLQYSDPFAQVLTHSIAQADQTHVFKLVGVYQLPFGKGKKFLTNAGGFTNRVAGGWEVNSSFNMHSGQPVPLPNNALILKDPKIQNVNYQQYQPRLWSNCVIQLNQDASRTLLNQNVCGTDASTYSWLALPQYSPNPNPQYSGQIRMSRATSMDLSINKSIPITERLRGQVRIEAFNVLNHFTYGDNTPNTTPTDPNFGSFFPSQLGNSASFPRQIQLGFKLVW